jgi:hypothetical protein
VNIAPVRELALEVRAAVRTFQDERSGSAGGAVVVGGMLAEQLAKELGAGARPGAVVLGDEPRLTGAAVAVKVIAGDPSESDVAFVRAADDRLVPVVLVQLWPQAEWRAPFVLSPFVVECRTGEGFPISEIAARIAEAVENGPALAVRVPVLADSVETAVVRSAVVRSTLLALSRRPGSRSRIGLEQVRMLSRLRMLDAPEEPDPVQAVAGVAVTSLLLSHAFQAAAGAAGRSLPRPLANAAVAAAGTWGIYRVARVVEARLPRG